MPDFYLYGTMIIGLGLIELSFCFGFKCVIKPCIDNNIIILTHNLFCKKIYETETETENITVNVNNTLEETQPLL
jgi:hypothetical protein